MNNLDYAIQELSKELCVSDYDETPELCSAFEEAIVALTYRNPLGLVGKHKNTCPRCGTVQNTKRLTNGTPMCKFCKECGQAFLFGQEDRHER